MARKRGSSDKTGRNRRDEPTTNGRAATPAAIARRKAAVVVPQLTLSKTDKQKEGLPETYEPGHRFDTTAVLQKKGVTVMAASRLPQDRPNNERSPMVRRKCKPRPGSGRGNGNGRQFVPHCGRK